MDLLDQVMQDMVQLLNDDFGSVKNNIAANKLSITAVCEELNSFNHLFSDILLNSLMDLLSQTGFLRTGLLYLIRFVSILKFFKGNDDYYLKLFRDVDLNTWFNYSNSASIIIYLVKP